MKTVSRRAQFAFLAQFVFLVGSSGQALAHEPAVAAGPTEPVHSVERGLGPAFDDLGRTWIDGRTNARERVSVASIDAVDGPEALSAARSGAAIFAAPPREARSLVEAVRYETNFAGSDVMPSAQLSPAAGAAASARDRARQAVADVFAGTSLGRSVGRFFFFRQTGPLDPARSRLIPLISPKLNARARSAGLAVIWRF